MHEMVHFHCNNKTHLTSYLTPNTTFTYRQYKYSLFLSFLSTIRHAIANDILLQPLCRGGKLLDTGYCFALRKLNHWWFYDNRLIWNPYTNKGSSSGLSYMTRLWKGKGDGVDSSNATQALACSSPSITCSGNSIWIYSFAEAARLSLVLPNPWEQVD
jgi:hypothetical protein